MPSAAAINAHFAERKVWEGRLKMLLAASVSMNPEEINAGALADACLLTAIRVALAGSGWKATNPAQQTAVEQLLRSAMLQTMGENGPPELQKAIANSQFENN